METIQIFFFFLNFCEFSSHKKKKTRQMGYILNIMCLQIKLSEIRNEQTGQGSVEISYHLKSVCAAASLKHLALW